MLLTSITWVALLSHLHPPISLTGRSSNKEQLEEGLIYSRYRLSQMGCQLGQRKGQMPSRLFNYQFECGKVELSTIWRIGVPALSRRPEVQGPLFVIQQETTCLGLTVGIGLHISGIYSCRFWHSAVWLPNKLPFIPKYVIHCTLVQQYSPGRGMTSWQGVEIFQASDLQLGD